MSPKNRVRWLVATHVIAGLIVSAHGATTRVPTLPWMATLTCLFALLLCQGTLLGAWAVFSGAPSWRRVVVVVAGALYLDLLANAPFPRHATVPVVSMLTLTVAGLLSLLRVSHVELQCIRVRGDTAFAGTAESRRTSTRGLMLAAGLVAVLLWGARWLRELPREEEYLQLVAGFAGLVVVSLLSLRATLGQARPLLKGASVLGTSLALGVHFAYVAHSPERFAFESIVAGVPLESGLIQGSLLVVRSCGWRLVRRRDDRRSVVERLQVS